MKQTAVEWLMARFESGDMYNVEDSQFIKQQAIKMEKEQIIESHLDGQGVNKSDTWEYIEGLQIAIQYYNKTH